MPSTRNNYKAKWLAAVTGEGAGVIAQAAEAKNIAESVISTDVTAHLELQKLQNVTYEAASIAKSLISLMNDASFCGGVDYGKYDHAIDTKMSKMPLHIVIRRIRDIMKLAEFRIGMLTVACDEMTEAGKNLSLELDSIRIQNQSLQKSTVSGLLLGPDPTSTEIEDFSDSHKGGRTYHRYGIVYPDLLDSVFDDFGVEANHRVQKRSMLTNSQSVDDSDDDSDESGTEDAQYSSTHLVKHKKKDSGIAGLETILGTK